MKTGPKFGEQISRKDTTWKPRHITDSKIKMGLKGKTVIRR
jgi:hypothetical protein